MSLYLFVPLFNFLTKLDMYSSSSESLLQLQFGFDSRFFLFFFLLDDLKATSFLDGSSYFVLIS
jgi:hypothetical protein